MTIVVADGGCEVCCTVADCDWALTLFMEFILTAGTITNPTAIRIIINMFERFFITIL